MQSPQIKIPTWSFIHSSSMRHISFSDCISLCGQEIDELFVVVRQERFSHGFLSPLKIFNECPECCEIFTQQNQKH